MPRMQILTAAEQQAFDTPPSLVAQNARHFFTFLIACAMCLRRYAAQPIVSVWS